MRTFLLLATAATAAFLAQNADAQTRTERRVIVVQPQGTVEEDGAVYRNGDDRALTERDYRGRWVEGEWTPDRRRFEGVYEVDERGARPDGWQRDRRGADFDAPPPGYEDRGAGYRGARWNDEDMMRRCRGQGGLAGALIGGAAGGLIGNRVAGRGDRGIGTAVGAVAGAAAGAAIERSVDRRACDEWARDYAARSQYTYGGGYGGYQGYDAYAGYGGMQTIVIPGQPVIIEETETTYETVVVPQPRPRVRHRVAPRRATHRPRPRPRCICR